MLIQPRRGTRKTRKREELGEREVRWQQVRYDLERRRGIEKILLRLQPMQDGDSVPVCFGMMHLMQKFSRDKVPSITRNGREGLRVSVLSSWVQKDSSCTTAPNDSGQSHKKQYEA